jgi:hypothetical protein
VGGERLFVCLFAFGVGSTMSSSVFELAAESETIFTLSRAWTATSLLDKSKINRALIEGDRSRDEACNGTNVCIGIPVRLSGLTVRIEGLVDGGGQWTTNWRFAWHCKTKETQRSAVCTSRGATRKAYWLKQSDV